ncbi:Copia protein [Symbiodinium microadriaticum]|uniref:Copia protein n=1 Tax=Symbiodinium microadriaticum TaxID=2951 RepID=A0A1Q9DMX0_SYMMI|nr:Copia protein [Symbiodinium microadriaticum]
MDNHAMWNSISSSKMTALQSDRFLPGARVNGPSKRACLRHCRVFSFMSTSGPSSLYEGYPRRGAPQPGDDSPPEHRDGVDDVPRGDDGSVQPRDDHNWAGTSRAAGDAWQQWSDGWQSRRWDHSWGGDRWSWNNSGWAQNAGSWPVRDRTWCDNKPWGSDSTGTGSADGGPDRDSKESSLDQWARRVSLDDSRGLADGTWPDGWGPSTEGQGRAERPKREEGSRGPSEKMVVPTFSGTTPGNGDDLGTSARSYLRQVAAWRRMTRMSEDQQALTLYQNLTDRAWIDAERLDMDRLATKQGVDYLIEWVKDRYLDVQVTQIGRSLSGFFRGLHRKAHQTVRDYLAEFDRAHARLTEVGCVLPDVAAAWVFVDRMGLEEQAELNLLASVGNQYSLKALQQAAIVHDRGLRKPWEQQPRNPKKEWTPRKPFTANLAGVDEGEELGDDNGFDPSDQEDCVSEEVAQDLFQAFMTHESAKQRYRENAKLRGSDPDSLKQLANDKLKAAKAKSFCAGCKRRGHWHKDAICPLNRGSAETSGGAADREKSSATTAATAATSTRTQSGMTVSSQYPCHVVHVTWEIEGYKNKDLLAITDTACSRSVAGAAWVDTYLIEARRLGCDPQFTSCREAFKFGASKIFVASYGIILGFEMGGFKVALKVAVVNGDVPLLVSRSALGKMGMLLDVAENRASFKALAVEDLLLEITETGHPAFQIKPSPLPKAFVQGPNWDTAEIKIFSQAEQYMGPPGVVGILHGDGDAADDASSSSRSEKCMTSWMVSVHGDDVDGDGVLLPGVPPGSNLPRSFEPMFYPKKIGPATRNMLLDVNFNPVTFAAWWGTTNISNDFWIEDEECLFRVHVIPRRSFFSPAHWRTQNTPHKEKLLSVLGAVRTINAVSCKSHKEFPAVHGLWSQVRDESSFPVLWIGRSDLYTAPMVMRTKTLSEFNKAELLEEAKARNLWVNDRWSTVELRSAIQEDRRNPSPNDPANATKGMASMTLDQLKTRAMELGYHLPPHGTRGTIMRILRDQAGMSSQSILGFGRFAGKAFEDTPVSYRTWALREVENNDNPSEDLVMFANWWQGQLHKWNDKVPEKPLVDRFDAERCATIPYVEDASSTASWDVLQRESLATPVTPQPKAKSGGYSAQAPRTPPTRRPAEEPAMPTTTRMEQEIPPEINEEVRFLEERLALLKDQHGVSYHLEGADGDTDADDEGNYDDYLDHLGFDDAAVSYVTEEKVRGRHGRVQACEAVAKEKLEKKEYTYEDLLEIARLLPLRKLRKGKALCRSGGHSFEYLLVGMYTHGNMKGLSRQSSEMPWVVKYMNSFVKAQGHGQWSSFVLFKNAATSVHADSHNLAGTMIKTVSFGPFTGGELWMSDPNRDPSIPGTVWRKDAAGNEIPGYLVNTKHQVYTFDGKAKHATQPWDGERWALSLYTTRGYQESTTTLRDQLRELRFPLRGLPLFSEAHGQVPGRFVRPVKSMRKSLWKKASRLAALTTWCATARLSCAAEAFPLTRGREAVALYEIGGVEKTLEVTSLDYLVAEPLDNLYNFTTSSVCETVQSTIREFTPAVVWIHGDKATGYLDGIYDYLCEHVDKGRQLAVKAPPGDPCWDSPELNKILRRYEGAWCYREQEPDVIRVNDLFYYHDNATDGRTIPQFDAYVADHTTGEAEGECEGLPIKSGAEAISFEKGKNLAPEVKSSLRRLHQNLGHPSNIDLARHLRLAGADPVVIDACKRIRCQVCQRNKRGGTPKPASLPTLLEFNQVVAVDAFYVYDCEGTKVELMMAIDVGTGFALAGELQGHSTLTMDATFCSLWSNTFGAPGTLVVDLESGLQAGLARYSEWHGTFIRPIAGQAHWQNGTVERAIRTWKEVWVKLVDERSANADEANMVITAVNSAMNTLRRESGFSPSQAVWGRDPKLPDDIHHSFQDDHVEHIISHDRQRAREHTLRIAAKECYYRCRNDAKLRKGLLQRSRVAGPDLQVGCHVFFYRKPKNNKNWVWHGPGVIIGQEGPNHWVSFSGRCHLVAPEHLRMASAEELGAAFALRATKEDLEKLLEQDFSEDVLFEDDGNEMEVDPELPPGDDQGLSDGDGRAEASRRKSEAAPPAPVPKRYRTKGPQEMESHDPTYDAYMMKMAKTPRGREKALEKEIPWSMVPPEQQENFKQAELKQYSEHVEHNALEPLSVELSRKVMEEHPDRVLNSRFAYRDKHWSRRRQEPNLNWKAKARLVIAGHRDPDLLSGLPTHAPTISRQGIHLLLQVLASNLRRGWKGFAGDVTAAFLCGEDLQRELYLRQPKTGLGDLHPEQLLRIRKPIFGLVDSPAAWWTKLHKTLKKMKVRDDNGEWIVVQNTLDHCIFMVQKIESYDEEGQPRLGVPEAYLGVHVDDVLLVGDGALCDLLKRQLSSEFPIQEWEEEKFEYVGSYIEVMEDRVKVSQASYAATRLFQVETDKNNPDHFEASDVEKHDNQSLIGALSWMASQTRPDLQVGVSMSQQCQKSPTVGDIRFTNQLARRAMEHKEEGLTFFPVDFGKAVLLCYHDAGWANVPQSDEDPYYRLTDEENLQGKIQDGPIARREAKMKKANSTIASQFGGLYILTDENVIYGEESRGSILDWKSGACERVCRSTFAAETMACSTATETGEFIAKFLETILTGKLARHSTRFGLRFLSDCRSLYDHLTRAHESTAQAKERACGTAEVQEFRQ